VLVQVQDCDVRALACKEHGHGAADAGIPAGDQRHLALELATAAVRRGLVPRRRIEPCLQARFGEVLPGHLRCGLLAGLARGFAVDAALQLALRPGGGGGARSMTGEGGRFHARSIGRAQARGWRRIPLRRVGCDRFGD
jgi:hypothetical protein